MGPGRKGNPPLRDIDFSPNKIFYNYFYIRYDSLQQIVKKLYTVNLCSKGPARKGNSPLRDIDFSPNKSFFSYSYIGYKKISVYGKSLGGPVKSLGANFHCIGH